MIDHAQVVDSWVHDYARGISLMFMAYIAKNGYCLTKGLFSST